MWKIYGTMQCNYCKASMKILDKFGIKYLFTDVSEHPEQMPGGHRTVPVIYNSSGSLVGGHNELTKYNFRSGNAQ